MDRIIITMWLYVSIYRLTTASRTFHPYLAFMGHDQIPIYVNAVVYQGPTVTFNYLKPSSKVEVTGKCKKKMEWWRARASWTEAHLFEPAVFFFFYCSTMCPWTNIFVMCKYLSHHHHFAIFQYVGLWDKLNTPASDVCPERHLANVWLPDQPNIIPAEHQHDSIVGVSVFSRCC